MSGTFPNGPCPDEVQISSVQPTLVSVTHSMRRQARSRGAQRWRVRMRWDNLTRAEISPLRAFVLTQRGQLETFELVVPGHDVPQGVATGTPVLAASMSIGSNTVSSSGWAPNVIGILKAGDFFKFAGHAKVYMVTADATSDGAGAATLSFAPRSIAAAVGGEALQVSAVPWTVAIASDIAEWPVRGGYRSALDLDMVEVPE